MFCWCSFSWWGREGIAICFAYKGSQKFFYDWVQPIGGVISQNAWSQIVDTYFHDGAGRVFKSVLPIKAANTPSITMCNLPPHRLPEIHDQQSLTFRWRSFSWWGMEGIAICFAYKGNQKFLYDSIHPIGGDISQDAWLKIVDAPLTLIFTMGQGGYCYLFCL